MDQVAPPVIKSVDGVFLMELGEDYSHLQEPFLKHLTALRCLAESADPARVVLDLSHVKVMGSAVIGLLVTAGKILAARGGSLALANVNTFCRSAISLTRLDSLLPMYGTTAEATQHIATS